jgi:hypothetical protein
VSLHKGTVLKGMLPKFKSSKYILVQSWNFLIHPHKMRRTELFTRLGSNNSTLYTSWVTIAFTKCTNITGKSTEVTSFLLNNIRWCNHCIYKSIVFVYFGMCHIFKTFVTYCSKCFVVPLTYIHKLWNVRIFKIEWVIECYVSVHLQSFELNTGLSSNSSCKLSVSKRSRHVSSFFIDPYLSLAW